MESVGRSKSKTKKTADAAIKYIILIVVGLLMIYPLLWLIGASFKENNEIFSSVGIIPKKFDVTGYINGWKTSTEYTFTKYFMNTFAIVVPKVILTLISCTLAAYGFARFKIPGKKFLFSILIGTLLLPTIVLNIPQYIMYRQIGWLDTYLPLIIPSLLATDTFFVFMLIQFIRGIPKELEEAAKIDGCNPIQTLWYVIVPVLKPAIISVALLQFMWSMNDFLGPLLYISSVEKYPVVLALRMAMDASAETKWNEMIAMSIVTILPSLVLFFAAQKHFVEGVTSGSVKG